MDKLIIGSLALLVAGCATKVICDVIIVKDVDKTLVKLLNPKSNTEHVCDTLGEIKSIVSSMDNKK